LRAWEFTIDDLLLGTKVWGNLLLKKVAVWVELWEPKEIIRRIIRYEDNRELTEFYEVFVLAEFQCGLL